MLGNLYKIFCYNFKICGQDILGRKGCDCDVYQIIIENQQETKMIY